MARSPPTTPFFDHQVLLELDLDSPPRTSERLVDSLMFDSPVRASVPETCLAMSMWSHAAGCDEPTSQNDACAIASQAATLPESLPSTIHGSQSPDIEKDGHDSPPAPLAPLAPLCCANCGATGTSMKVSMCRWCCFPCCKHCQMLCWRALCVSYPLCVRGHVMPRTWAADIRTQPC